MRNKFLLDLAAGRFGIQVNLDSWTGSRDAADGLGGGIATMSDGSVSCCNGIHPKAAIFVKLRNLEAVKSGKGAKGKGC